MTPLLIIAVAGLATYVLRVTPMAVLSRRALPSGVDRALRHASPAVLAGLVAAGVAQGGGLAALAVPSPRLVAVLAGALVAWRTRNMLATVALALGVYWLLVAVWP